MLELVQLLKENQKFIIVLCVFILLDIISGIVRAILSKELKSSVFRDGLLKKSLEFIIVILGFSCDWAFGMTVLGKAVLMFEVAMEGYSILENISEYVPIPEKLKEFLDQVKEGKE